MAELRAERDIAPTKVAKGIGPTKTNKAAKIEAQAAIELIKIFSYAIF